MAKGFVMGTQFEGLFENDNYVKYCKRAVENADKIRSALSNKGVGFESNASDTQTFAIFTKEQYLALEKEFDFGGATFKGEKAYARICTSWATPEENVEMLLSAISKL